MSHTAVKTDTFYTHSSKDHFQDILINTIQVDPSKRWTIEQIIDHLENMDVEKKFFSKFEEIEFIRQKLEDELGSSIFYELYNTVDMDTQKVTLDQLRSFKRLQALEEQYYS